MEQLQTKHKFIAFLLFLLTALSLYYMTFQFDYFFFDDYKTFQENPAIYDVTNIKEIFLTFKTRFLPGYTFALNYAIGGITHFWFRLTNILIHGVNSFLAYLLALELLSLAVKRQQIKLPSVQLTAFFTGLLFLVHPVQTEPINLVVQRMTMMSTMFYILTSYLFIRLRRTGSKRYFIFAFLSCISAMFCKENAFTLPFMIIIIDQLLFKDQVLSRKRYLQYIPFLLTLLIIPFLLRYTTPEMTHTARIASMANEDSPHFGQMESLSGEVDITRAGHTRSVSRYKYFLTEINVLRTYVELFFVPVNQHFVRTYPLSLSIFDPETLLTAFLWIIVMLLAFFLRKKHPVITLAAVWFFLTLSIESSVIPIGHLIAEYRMYIAMFGLSLLVCYVVAVNIRSRRIVILLLSSIIFVMAWTTSSRNMIWEDESTLWEDNYSKSPKDARVVISYARTLMMRGENERALGLYYKVVNQLGCNEILCQNIFSANLQLGKYSRAAYILMRMKVELGESYGYYFLKGVLSGSIGDLDAAEIYFRKALKFDNKSPDAYHSLCALYEKREDLRKALACYGKAIDLAPYDFDFYARKAMIFLVMKDEDGYHEFMTEIRKTSRKRFADQIEEAVLKIKPLIR